MKRSYHTIRRNSKASEEQLARFLVQNGQQLLPLVQLIEQSQLMLEEVIEVLGRATIEAVLQLSARELAGDPQQGRRRPGTVLWHGAQPGRVYLRDRQLRVRRPRLRRRGCGSGKEVEIPAYAALQDGSGLGARVLEILLHGVSTRHYQRVVPEMADSLGISKSSISREAIEASEAALRQLLERRLEDREFLILYIDTLYFGQQCVVGVVGVDTQGEKLVLGLREGATENAATVKDLLQDLVARGLNPEQKLLFVIDGSKALRAAINSVFGAHTPVQRCRHHKLRNVLERLPLPEHAQVRSLMKAAWKLGAKDGMARFEKLAQWLESQYPEAAASLREGLEECFTINRLEVPTSLHRCLASTNLMESSQSGVRMRTRRICRWQPGMAQRWAAAAFLETEKSFRRIIGYRDLWALKAILEGRSSAAQKGVA